MALAMLAQGRLGARAMAPQASWAGRQWPAAASVARFATKAKAEGEPKRPATPWLRFVADFRDKQKAAENPMKPTAVLIAASAEWKALPDSEKEVYNKPYEAEKKEYDAWKAGNVSAAPVAKTDPSRPKRPQTPFLLFAQEFRSKNPELKVVEGVTQASAAWKEMSEAEREPYEKQYLAAKESYEGALKQYKESGKETEWKAKKTGPAGKAAVAETKAQEKLEKTKKKLEEVNKKMAETKKAMAALRIKGKGKAEEKVEGTTEGKVELKTEGKTE